MLISSAPSQCSRQPSRPGAGNRSLAGRKGHYQRQLKPELLGTCGAAEFCSPKLFTVLTGIQGRSCIPASFIPRTVRSMSNRKRGVQTLRSQDQTRQPVSAASRLSGTVDPGPTAQLQVPSCRRQEGPGHDLLIFYTWAQPQTCLNNFHRHSPGTRWSAVLTPACPQRPHAGEALCSFPTWTHLGACSQGACSQGARSRGAHSQGAHSCR